MKPETEVFISVAAGAIALLGREHTEAMIVRLIGHLDQTDGDPDAEDGDEDACHARDDGGIVPHIHDGYGDGHAGDPDDAEDDDPGGTDIDCGELDEGHRAPTPIFGIDQTAGAIGNSAQGLNWWYRNKPPAAGAAR